MMKYFNYVLLSFLILIPIIAFAQENKDEDVEKISFNFEEGVQRINDKRGNTVLIEIKRDEIVKVSVQKPGGNKVQFKKSTEPRKGDCECGYECWEDHSAQQSICVCKTCGGGSGGKLSYVALNLGY